MTKFISRACVSAIILLTLNTHPTQLLACALPDDMWHIPLSPTTNYIMTADPESKAMYERMFNETLPDVCNVNLDPKERCAKLESLINEYLTLIAIQLFNNNPDALNRTALTDANYISLKDMLTYGLKLARPGLLRIDTDYFFTEATTAYRSMLIIGLNNIITEILVFYQGQESPYFDHQKWFARCEQVKQIFQAQKFFLDSKKLHIHANHQFFDAIHAKWYITTTNHFMQILEAQRSIYNKIGASVFSPDPLPSLADPSPLAPSSPISYFNAFKYYSPTMLPRPPVIKGIPKSYKKVVEKYWPIVTDFQVQDFEVKNEAIFNILKEQLSLSYQNSQTHDYLLFNIRIAYNNINRLHEIVKKHSDKLLQNIYYSRLLQYKLFDFVEFISHDEVLAKCDREEKFDYRGILGLWQEHLSLLDETFGNLKDQALVDNEINFIYHQYLFIKQLYNDYPLIGVVLKWLIKYSQIEEPVGIIGMSVSSAPSVTYKLSVKAIPLEEKAESVTKTFTAEQKSLTQLKIMESQENESKLALKKQQDKILAEKNKEEQLKAILKKEKADRLAQARQKRLEEEAQEEKDREITKQENLKKKEASLAKAKARKDREEMAKAELEAQEREKELAIKQNEERRILRQNLAAKQKETAEQKATKAQEKKADELKPILEAQKINNDIAPETPSPAQVMLEPAAPAILKQTAPKTKSPHEKKSEKLIIPKTQEQPSKKMPLLAQLTPAAKHIKAKALAQQAKLVNNEAPGAALDSRDVSKRASDMQLGDLLARAIKVLVPAKPLTNKTPKTKGIKNDSRGQKDNKKGTILEGSRDTDPPLIQDARILADLPPLIPSRRLGSGPTYPLPAPADVARAPMPVTNLMFPPGLGYEVYNSAPPAGQLYIYGSDVHLAIEAERSAYELRVTEYNQQVQALNFEVDKLSSDKNQLQVIDRQIEDLMRLKRSLKEGVFHKEAQIKQTTEELDSKLHLLENSVVR